MIDNNANSCITVFKSRNFNNSCCHKCFKKESLTGGEVTTKAEHFPFVFWPQHILPNFVYIEVLIDPNGRSSTRLLYNVYADMSSRFELLGVLQRWV